MAGAPAAMATMASEGHQHLAAASHGHRHSQGGGEKHGQCCCAGCGCGSARSSLPLAGFGARWSRAWPAATKLEALRRTPARTRVAFALPLANGPPTV